MRYYVLNVRYNTNPKVKDICSKSVCTTYLPGYTSYSFTKKSDAIEAEEELKKLNIPLYKRGKKVFPPEDK